MKKMALLFAATLMHCSLFSQIYPVRATLEDEKSFSMIVIPDPQSYVKFDANQPLFDLQTAWIANSQKSLNILTALCTGDIVEQNDIRLADGRNGNQTSEEQWKSASRAFERLDNKMPYILCTGNHDYGYESSENRNSRFHEYFPAERNFCWKDHLVSTGKNAFGIYTLENAAYEFNTDTWGKLLIVSIEFAPRDEAIAWAKNLIASKKYENHKVILLTHSFITAEGTRRETEGYQLKEANYGQALWDKLVYPSPNIRLVVCGHECEITDYKGQVGYRMDKNIAGKDVAQMMFNAQTADGQWFGNGGDCWLRIMEFMPNGKTIKIKTFSPLFALSPSTKDKAWRKAPYDEFEIVIK